MVARGFNLGLACGLRWHDTALDSARAGEPRLVGAPTLGTDGTANRKLRHVAALQRPWAGSPRLPSFRRSATRNSRPEFLRGVHRRLQVLTSSGRRGATDDGSQGLQPGPGAWTAVARHRFGFSAGWGTEVGGRSDVGDGRDGESKAATCRSTPKTVGWKPTATIVPSLRDSEFTAGTPARSPRVTVRLPLEWESRSDGRW
jgi:hypothetical protein